MALHRFGRPPRDLTLGTLAAIAATAALLAGAGRLVAEPLTADACERLRTEKAELVKAGVPGNMSRGPAWARANLDKVRLGEIERFLDVEDALAFRCVRPLPPEVVKAIEQETAGPAEPPPATATPAPKAKQKAVPPAPSAKAASDQGGQAGSGSDGAVPPAPKPKIRRPPPAKSAAPESTGPQKAEPKAP